MQNKIQNIQDLLQEPFGQDVGRLIGRLVLEDRMATTIQKKWNYRCSFFDKGELIHRFHFLKSFTVHASSLSADLSAHVKNLPLNSLHMHKKRIGRLEIRSIWILDNSYSLSDNGIHRVECAVDYVRDRVYLKPDTTEISLLIQKNKLDTITRY